MLTLQQLQAQAEIALRKRREEERLERRWPENHVLGPEGEWVPFHLGQTRTWESERRFTAMVAGTQSGKTCWGPWWLWREIERLGAGDYYAVTATYDLFKLKMLPELLRVYRDVLRVGRYWSGDRILELRDPETGHFQAQRSSDPMWGRVILRSADSPGGLESGTAKAAWLDEAGQDRFTVWAWRAIRRRLALYRGRALITTTLYNLGWLKQQVMDAATDGGTVTLEETDIGAEVETTDNPAADVRLVQFDSIANPAFPVEEFKDAEASTPDDEFAMFYRGRAVKLRSLIYDVFSDLHKVKSFKPPMDWPRAVGVDPLGERVCALWLAFDPNKEQLHVYREYYAPFGETTPGHVREVLRLSAHERIAAWIGGGPSERQARADWAGAGIALGEPPFGEVWVGIGRVYAQFKTFGLVIHDCCENLLDELGTYQRKRDRAGELTEIIKDKERYHGLDALRYIMAWLTEPADEVAIVHRPVRIW